MNKWKKEAHGPTLLVLGVLLSGVGCNGGPARIAPPQWDPKALAEKAMTLLDANGDDLLNQAELSAAPGLASALWHLDADKDRSISRAELMQRLELYDDLGTGLMSLTLRVTLNGKPLTGAEVRLVPERFLEGVIEPAAGTTDRNGVVAPRSEIEDIPAVRVGFYRVEVTSPAIRSEKAMESVKTLGVEASPVSDGEQSSGMFELAIQS